MIIYPYNRYSASAKALAAALGVKRVRPDSLLNPRKARTVLNMGNSTLPAWHTNLVRYLNKPQNVAVAASKLATFQALQQAQVSIPEFTVDHGVATGWLLGGSTVVSRALLRGSEGRGIGIHEAPATELPRAPLYVQYIKKLHEYRVHVFNGQVIDTQIKRKRNGVERDSTRIRNLANGYIFAREGIESSEARNQLAVSAVSALELDFGAVDIIYNRHSNAYYVLEVNTSPGLEGTTLNNYVTAIRALG